MNHRKEIDTQFTSFASTSYLSERSNVKVGALTTTVRQLARRVESLPGSSKNGPGECQYKQCEKCPLSEIFRVIRF